MRKIGKELFTFQKLIGGYIITNFTTVFDKKKLVESRRWKRFCLTKQFSGRVYLHNGQTSFSFTPFFFFMY
jgi:hypothetical protein